MDFLAKAAIIDAIMDQKYSIDELQRLLGKETDDKIRSLLLAELRRQFAAITSRRPKKID